MTNVAKELSEKIIGLEWELAKYAVRTMGYRFRIIRNEEILQVVVRDYVPSRINVSIINGKISDANVG